jgi:hypothetical protein
LLIALLVVVANELIDRVFFDEYHVAADAPDSPPEDRVTPAEKVV